MADGDKEAIKAATDLVELIGSYVQVRRDGSGWKCCCPWHDDHKPSMTINQNLNLWRCWVCDISGDCFSWVMRMEGVGFPEAKEKLAERAGIAIEKYQAEGVSRRKSILETLATVVAKYHSSLNQDCKHYLKSRSISAESVSKWQLGSCVPWDSTGFSLQSLVDAGVVGVSSGGRKYDRFKDRLIFPITDIQGRAIAMGGRVLPGKDSFGGKYVNSPETDVFKKSKTLYGLRNARDGIRKSGMVLVMEGYTDVIISHQAGVDFAVACLGTAFTEEHLKQLAHQAQKVVIVLDGDEAGQKRSDAIIPVLVKSGIPSSIVTIPGGDDPADWILKHGRDAFLRLIDRALDPIYFRVHSICKGIDPQAKTAEAAMALNSAIELLSTCSADRMAFATPVLASMFRVPQAEVDRKLNDKLSKVARRPEAKAVKKWGGISLTEREVVKVLMRDSVTAFPILQERIDRSWLCDRVRSLWNAFEFNETNGKSIEWKSVVESLPLDSAAKSDAAMFELSLAEDERIDGVATTPTIQVVESIVSAFARSREKQSNYEDYF